jgi:hypothetical protein
MYKIIMETDTESEDYIILKKRVNRVYFADSIYRIKETINKIENKKRNMIVTSIEYIEGLYIEL